MHLEQKMEFAKLDISGLQSKAATDSVRSALAAINGVSEIRLSPERGVATLWYDPGKVWPHQLRVAVRAVGCCTQLITLQADIAR